ncbi:hypothetical protein LshimejAT787_2200630 [Lyophyllum shimeji]|uniref:Uncharacterized protein n=1 Tax=Lyophyllum shimeji TaxID=47721 RepID=A0A9P3UV26_LYOSH|nr:hypothetical protein LshimejAT787_2200630 [Lyophyllum shimeji]
MIPSLDWRALPWEVGTRRSGKLEQQDSNIQERAVAHMSVTYHLLDPEEDQEEGPGSDISGDSLESLFGGTHHEEIGLEARGMDLDQDTLREEGQEEGPGSYISGDSLESLFGGAHHEEIGLEALGMDVDRDTLREEDQDEGPGSDISGDSLESLFGGTHHEEIGLEARGMDLDRDTLREEGQEEGPGSDISGDSLESLFGGAHHEEIGLEALGMDVDRDTLAEEGSDNDGDSQSSLSGGAQLAAGSDSNDSTWGSPFSSEEPQSLVRNCATSEMGGMEGPEGPNEGENQVDEGSMIGEIGDDETTTQELIGPYGLRKRHEPSLSLRAQSSHNEASGTDGAFNPATDSSESCSSSESAWDSDVDSTSNRASDVQRPRRRQKRVSKNYARGRRNPRVARVTRPPLPEQAFTFAGEYRCSTHDHSGGGVCGVLEAFKLMFSPTLNVVFSPELAGGCLIPASQLSNYLRKHCSTSLGLGRQLLAASEWNRITNHVIVEHGLDPDQCSESLLASLPSNLPAPLPVLGEVANKSSVARFFKCPAPGCSTWAIAANGVAKYNIRDHYRDNHDRLGAATKDYESFLAQKIMIYGSQNTYHVFKLDTCVAPLATSQLPVLLSFENCKNEPVDARTQDGAWLEKLGWVQYLDSLGASVDTLRALVTPPTEALSQVAGLGAESRYIEMGLLQLYRESALYLNNASDFLEVRHPSVRLSITAGFKSSRFRVVTRKTLSEYRQPLVLTLTFMIRLLQAKESGHCDGLGTLRIHGHPKQVDAAGALRNLFLESKGQPDIEKMRKLMHAAFDYLLRPPHLEDTLMACPTDQVLFLMCLVDGENFSSAHGLQGLCAGLQYSFRCVMVHIARLRSTGETSYTPWVQPSNGELRGREQVAAEEDNFLVEGDQHDDISEDEDLPSDFEGSDGPSAKDAEQAIRQRRGTVRFDEQVMLYLAEEVVWVKKSVVDAPNTPFARFRDAWHIASQYAKKESNGTSFRPSSDGQKYEFFDAREGSLIVDMLLWRDTLADLSLRNLPEAIEALVPNDCVHLIKDLPVDLVEDQHSTQLAVHKQPHNAAILEPIRTKIQDALLTASKEPRSLVNANGQLVAEKLAGWLDQEQEVLAIVAAIFALSAGPTFRSFQFRGLRYDSSPDHDARNLFFLPNGRIILANPRAKQLNADNAPVALSFPPLTSPHLSFFFWILKPVAINLLDLAKMDVPAYCWCIWVTPNPRSRRTHEPHFWQGSDFNRKIQRLTRDRLGFQIDCGLVRQISHAVLRDKLPSLFDSPELTATALMSLVENGPLRDFANALRVPTFVTLSQKEGCISLLVSELWQMVLGLRELNTILEFLVPGSNLFPTLKYSTVAFHRARGAIQEFYGVPMLRGNQISSIPLAADILANEPFLLGNLAGGSRRLGDDALRVVTYAVLFGNSKPRLGATAPLGGLHVDDVALAACSVSLVV